MSHRKLQVSKLNLTLCKGYREFYPNQHRITLIMMLMIIDSYDKIIHGFLLVIV